ncbi:hypothetical protein MUGA111182_05825 [Mucilaginibacter galii]
MEDLIIYKMILIKIHFLLKLFFEKNIKKHLFNFKYFDL